MTTAYRYGEEWESVASRVRYVWPDEPGPWVYFDYTPGALPALDGVMQECQPSWIPKDDE